jgi:hypothetical protein
MLSNSHTVTHNFSLSFYKPPFPLPSSPLCSLFWFPMGIRNSKLNPEGEPVPAKIRPVIRRWFEKIRRRKNANMSKKELLKEGVEDSESSQTHSLHDKERSSTTSSSDESVPISKEIPVEKEELKVAPVPTRMPLPLPLPESDITSKEPEEHKDEEKCAKQDGKDCKDAEGENEKEDEVVEKSVVIVEKVVVVEETMVYEEEEEEEENEKVRNICPGSPSFRVYCVHSVEDNDEESKYS